MLQMACPDLTVWLDTENLDEVTPDALQEAVRGSDVMIVFLSRDYLASKYCRLELATAREAQIPIIFVRDAEARHGGFDRFSDLISREREAAIHDDRDKDAIGYVRSKVDRKTATYVASSSDRSTIRLRVGGLWTPQCKEHVERALLAVVFAQ